MRKPNGSQWKIIKGAFGGSKPKLKKGVRHYKKGTCGFKLIFNLVRKLS